MKRISLFTIAVLIAAVSVNAAFAASSTAKAKTKKPHTSMLGKLMHPKAKPGAPAGAPTISGSIIGDKKTHVYHLPSDKYTLPAVQNRVYFKTVAQATAAGYRHAGSGAASGKRPMKKMGMKMSSKSTGHGHAMKTHKMATH